MKSPIVMLAAAALLAAPTVLPAPAVAATPIKVTRFHLNQPIPPGTVAIEMAPDATVAPGPEAQVYSDAVMAAMQANGFTAATDPAAADYRVLLTVNRSSEDLPPAPPPFSIGLGGGGGGGNVAGGGAVSFGVGKRRQRALVTTQIAARIMHGTPPAAVWEGRATQAVEERGKLVQPADTANKLARALFKGFPGESGRTINVK